MQLLRKDIHTLKDGFTLVEMLVSLALFSVVIVIGIGSLLTMIDANAKAQALYSSATNLSFALDAMTRELRTGLHYYCDSRSASSDSVPDIESTHDCTNGNFITFTRERDGEQYGYRLKNGSLEQYSDGVWIAITSTKDVIVDHFVLNVDGTDPYTDGSDRIQPSIRVSIKGRVNNGLDTDTVFSVQTDVTQRRIDVY